MAHPSRSRWGSRPQGLLLNPLLLTPLLLLPLLLSAPQATARPMRGGGVGGPASGAGVRPGAGFGEAGPGLYNRGGVGGPASGRGVRPGAGWGAPGAGVVRRPGVGTWNPAWQGGRYWQARPWTAGWYRVNPAGWGWWGARSAAWGVASLATASAVTDLVDAAVEEHNTVIVVPQTSIQLDYASVQAVPPKGASFAYAISGGSYSYGQADCDQGLLQGQPPSTADQAQLLNAVCQIAYGPG
ncbi:MULTISPECIES: hypothetical protein [unclassified Synechococcus]|uniref:hypothetical protein n=1 Tax=unclassified Synechococcus TaxID=2626047 RepID=UPI0018CD343E|nr:MULTISPECIES: hypothetical protein [unclassified Synechococcus]MEA5421862.1 hypothetical protein [Synechococcus sp. CCY9202]QPN60405.1 hypothetical protein H8F24_02875 [Synechococcus sp. CBW1002]CAK6689250.1 hypothetical protein IFHNHDMJ_00570 [Synechococcus sp. CBW1107]